MEWDEHRIRALRPHDDSAAARLAFVRQLYHEVLGREGDAAGIAAHSGALAGGTSPTAVIEAFLTSPEYQIRAELRARHVASDQIDRRAVPPLHRWHRRSWDEHRKIAFVGDSTTTALEAGPAAAWAAEHLIDTGELPHTDYRVFGSSGSTLHEFLNVPLGQVGLAQVVAYAPDLILFSYGINDVRLGLTDAEALTMRLEQALTAFAATLPDCDVVLRMPNSLLTTGLNIASVGGNTVTEAAQAYSDILRDAYLAAAGAHPYLLHYPTRGTFFPGICSEHAFYMFDDIHPTGDFYIDFLEDLTRRHIGRSASRR